MPNNNFMYIMPEYYIKKIVKCLNIPIYVDIEVNELVRQVLQSLSLNFTAKNDVFSSVPRLVQSQFEALEHTFDDEILKMNELYNKHPEQIARLVGKNIVQAIVIGVFMEVLKTDADTDYLVFTTLKKCKRAHPEIYELGRKISTHSSNWCYLINVYDRYENRKNSVDLEWLNKLV